ncbi:MAG: thiamine biosynthesis protein [Aeromicrobium sp.]|nr:thiamine biosynthesis protein [Aeromicrobium sp.]
MTASCTWSDWSCKVRVTVDRESALEDARAIVIRLMDDVAQSVDRFRPDSELSAINAAAGRMIPVSRRTIALLDTAIEAASATGGAVDPTIGFHVQHAGYDTDIETVRASIQLARPLTLQQADWTRVRVDHDVAAAGIPAGFQLDLGATAKAWTADTAARDIAHALGTAVLVEIGGDLSVAGRRMNSWQVDVGEQSGVPAQRIGLAHGGLATSSTAVRRWRTSDGEAHHIIDPRTGRPSTGPWRTATVWAATAVEANTASTAALVLGDEAVAYLNEAGLAARLVGRFGQIWTTAGWPRDVKAA